MRRFRPRAERDGYLVQPARRDRQHVPAVDRRQHDALASVHAAHDPRRLQAAHPVRPGPGLAASLRRARAATTSRPSSSSASRATSRPGLPRHDASLRVTSIRWKPDARLLPRPAGGRRTSTGSEVELRRRDASRSSCARHPQARNGVPNPRTTAAQGTGPDRAVSQHQADLGERCQGNTNCVPICPVQAKYDARRTLFAALGDRARRPARRGRSRRGSSVDPETGAGHRDRVPEPTATRTRPSTRREAVRGRLRAGGQRHRERLGSCSPRACRARAG